MRRMDYHQANGADPPKLMMAYGGMAPMVRGMHNKARTSKVPYTPSQQEAHNKDRSRRPSKPRWAPLLEVTSGQATLSANPLQPQDGQDKEDHHQLSRVDKVDGNRRLRLHHVHGHLRQDHTPGSGKADYRRWS